MLAQVTTLDTGTESVGEAPKRDRTYSACLTAAVFVSGLGSCILLCGGIREGDIISVVI